MSLTGARP